jgi:thioredoxin-dependent peroxiredoxin
MTLVVGDKAPSFTLPSGTGEQVTLSDVIGRRTVVLFFYPKDDTPGCTVEACTFRDRYEAFAQAGAEIIGISSDSQASHENFASKHKLPMKLLTDIDGKVRALYGVRATLGLFPGRATFVIDKAGTIRHVFASQLRVKSHVDQALEVVKRLGRADAVADGAATARP